MKNITFKCGTEPSLTDEIIVKRTYASILEGVPDEQINTRLIRKFVSETSPQDAHLINPTISMVNNHPKLPKYSCAIQLTHLNPAHDPNNDLSYATIIWYQEGNPLVTGFDIIDLAKSLEWKEVAQDACW